MIFYFGIGILVMVIFGLAVYGSITAIIAHVEKNTTKSANTEVSIDDTLPKDEHDEPVDKDIHCEYCGGKIEQGATVCSSCGAKKTK